MPSLFSESSYFAIVRGQKKGILASLCRAALALLSLPYNVVVSIRNTLYDYHWVASFRPQIPVISVGNLVLGGTGKTPVVHLLLRSLPKMSCPAILLRGYRAPAENQPKPYAVQGKHLTPFDKRQIGDEAQLHAVRFPESWIVVNRNRVASAQLAAAKGAHLLILDDGFQHRRLARDFDVVVMDGRDLFGLNFLFPRGFLRESPTALKRASLVVINHAAPAQFSSIRQQLVPYTSAPLVFTSPRLAGLHPVGTQIPLTSKKLVGKKVALFCAIGSPDAFFQTIQQLQAEVVDTLVESDHRPISEEKLAAFAAEAEQKGATALLCTEKDWVKLITPVKASLPVYWVEMELAIIEGEEAWSAFIQRVLKK